MLYFIIVIKSLASSTTSLRCSSTPQSEYYFSLPAYTFHFTHPCCRDQILFFLAKQRRLDQAESILGTCCMHRMISIAKVSAQGAPDRGTDAIGDGGCQPRPNESSLLSFVQQTLLDPGGVLCVI